MLQVHSITNKLVLGTGLLLMASPSIAQKVAAPAVIDTVNTFNQICYRQVPGTKGIENMALEFGWKPLDSNSLAAFGNKDALTYLKGWDVLVGERFYRLGVSRGPVLPEMKSNFPEFANGVVTSCTMILDGSDEKSEIANKMNALAGKEPASKNVDDGKLLTTTWAGGNADFKVFLLNKESKDTGEGGILNVTIISKN